jgi:hypothetical protein
VPEVGSRWISLVFDCHCEELCRVSKATKQSI